MKKRQNGRESLRRLKPIVGCNASKRKRIPSKSFTDTKQAVYRVRCNEDHYRPHSSNLLKEQSSLHRGHSPISLLTFLAIFETYSPRLLDS